MLLVDLLDLGDVGFKSYYQYLLVAKLSTH